MAVKTTENIAPDHRSAILAELARRKAEKAAAAGSQEPTSGQAAATAREQEIAAVVNDGKPLETAPIASDAPAEAAPKTAAAPAEAPAAAKKKTADKSKIKLTVLADAKPAKPAGSGGGKRRGKNAMPQTKLAKALAEVGAKEKVAKAAQEAKEQAKTAPKSAPAKPAKAAAATAAAEAKPASLAEEIKAVKATESGTNRGESLSQAKAEVSGRQQNLPKAKAESAEGEQAPVEHKEAKRPKVAKSKFSGLMAQIEAQKAKMEASGQLSGQGAKKASRSGSGSTAGQSRSKGSRKSAKERFSEPAMHLPEGDRYKQMAEAVEKLQKEKVIAEARAQLAKAGSHEPGKRKERKEKRKAAKKEEIELKALEKGIDPSLVLDASVVKIISGSTVQEVADALAISSSEIVKRLFLLGTPLTATQTMSDDLIELVADDLGRKVRLASPEEEFEEVVDDKAEDLVPRPPVVTVMGHVDHGKTSLLDTIRKTGVVETEAGGITQHIGASVVNIKGRQITFIDTPGHEAFTAMRARGAKVTDIVVLVVAADDGVMPQTIEAINHANAAKVPIVVAVNKIDKPGANPEKVRKELSDYGVIPEEWGGQNMFQDISAKQNLNIDELLELILLQADVLELKANPNALASGFVIEAKLDKGRGPLATVLVQRGTLHVGDNVVIGTTYGHVRAMLGPRHQNVTEATPADPVEILGLNSVPEAGDNFRVFAEEKDARALAEQRSLRARMMAHARSKVSLENLFERIEQENLSELDLIVKADVQGSIEALEDALAKMDQSEVKINVIHAAVGGITETDVTLASASDAIIIGFNVRPDAKAKLLAEHEQVEIKTYKVIYEAIEEINAARVGMLAPEEVTVETASLTVKELFKVSKIGTIAGCMVDSGEISKTDKVRVVRNGAVVHDGQVASLHHFKDEVSSMRSGQECGLTLANFQDIHVGDTLESYRIDQVARTE
jgi:translation initiation factor IF-2